MNRAARRSRSGPPDLTVVAVPAYFAAMGAEYLLQRRRLARGGPPTAGDYERRDTVASLTMGTASLIVPLLVPRLLRPFAPGRGRFGKVLLGTALGAAAVTTVADAIARRSAQPAAAAPMEGPNPVPAARRVASIGGVAAIAAGGMAVTTACAAHLTPDRFWRKRILPSLGTGPLALGLAVLGWDFIYYWNHRFMHESRYMWAIHVVHHSSERYNLATALRQPVADALGTTLPYGILCLVGLSPELVATARGVNLLYQFWIHTEAVGRIGPAEELLNTPSHHRVHHGSNRQYLDRNHGSILIVWDRLFGTFEPEGERVVYGLTKNLNSFDPVRIATHEHADIFRDVARSTSWGERFSYVLRGPGWATDHRPAAA
jgi:sterol desaturase/sphingolipid hydroxylase (fatty acid hydroxylase superfamily)